jgi:hypothetical protein
MDVFMHLLSAARPAKPALLLAVLLVTALPLSACNTPGERALGGGVIGGLGGAGIGALASGGLVGPTLAAAAVGAAGGAIIGVATTPHHHHYGYRRHRRHHYYY